MHATDHDHRLEKQQQQSHYV